WIGAIGIPVGIWALWTYLNGSGKLPEWTIFHSCLNITFFIFLFAGLYRSTWERTAVVLHTKRERFWYLLRINPFFVMIWWLIWLAPLWIGWRMYRKDTGLVWARTLKLDKNATLVRRLLEKPPEPKLLGKPPSA